MGPYPIEYLLIGLALLGGVLYLLMRFVLEKAAKRLSIYKGTKTGALIGCIGFLVMGAFPLYQVIAGLPRGEIYCAFRHNCNRMILLSEQPDYFWVSFVIWLVFAIPLWGGGLYGLYLVFVKKRYAP